ncbi:MAG: hypothetical protein JNL81_05635 [Hyphomonadaceae bacterium]|nr:hypothetical protein [Hyphomonadaceae bacterium]
MSGPTTVWRMRALVLFLSVVALTACEPAFDRERWASARGADITDSPRGSMVCPTIAAGVVPGATREEIRALLGPPDNGDSGASDVYSVGLEFTAPDEILLSIYYGDTNVVQDVLLHHDWGVEYLRPRTPGTCGGNWSFVRSS